MSNEGPLPPDDALLVGHVGRPHGVRGELRVAPVSGDAERLLGLSAVWLLRDDGGAERRAVTGARAHAGATLLTLDGIDDRDAAAGLAHAEVWARTSELPPPGPDEFSVAEVLGCVLQDVGAGAEPRDVGTVVALVDAGGRHLFEVERRGRRVLVPAVKDWLVDWSPAEKRLSMRLPNGLLDDEE